MSRATLCSCGATIERGWNICQVCRDAASLRSARNRTQKAILYEHAAAAGMEPCSDLNCVLGRPGGAGTNGGCRCGRDLSRTGLSIWLAHLRLALSNMAEEIREAREKAGMP